MKKISDFLVAASGVFGVIPGIAILISNIGVPPNASKQLFAAIIEALGVMTLILLWINKDWISRQSIKTYNKILLSTIFLFIASLFTYIFLYGYLVEEVPNSNPLFFPFWAKGELKQGLELMGSRAELIKQWGRDDVYKVIIDSSKTPLLITTLLMLSIYQLVFVSLTFIFGSLGIKASE